MKYYIHFEDKDKRHDRWVKADFLSKVEKEKLEEEKKDVPPAKIDYGKKIKSPATILTRNQRRLNRGASTSEKPNGGND